MKRITLTAIIVFMILLVTVVLTSRVAQANYFPPPSIEIFSPIPAPDVHSSASVTLNVRVNVLPSEADITFIRYSLDGKANATLTDLRKEDNLYYWTTTKDVFAQGKAFSAETPLGNLADGDHLLIVYAHYADGKEMSRSREFIVDTSCKPFTSPELLLLSPLNQTYTAKDLPLTFVVNETTVSANYVLDNQGGNVSLSSTGNTTLNGLSEGTHKLTVTVLTGRGLASQSVFFNVAQERSNEKQPLQTALAVGAFGGVAALVAIGLAIFMKRKSRLSGIVKNI